jgi:hypothetical protein
MDEENHIMNDGIKNNNALGHFSFIFNYSPFLSWNLLEILNASIKYSVPDQSDHCTNSHRYIIAIYDEFTNITARFTQFLFLFRVADAK